MTTILAYADGFIPLWDMGLRLILSLLIGAAIGSDRQRSHKPAGLRTMMLVSLGACTVVLVVVSYQGAGGSGMSPTESARVIQGIFSGIGFLGAGAIIHSGTHTEGITTAAAIWVTAAFGVALGMGEYRLGLGAGVLAYLTLTVVSLFEHRWFPRNDQQPPPSSEQPADRDDRTKARDE